MYCSSYNVRIKHTPYELRNCICEKIKKTFDGRFLDDNIIIEENYNIIMYAR